MTRRSLLAVALVLFVSSAAVGADAPQRAWTAQMTPAVSDSGETSPALRLVRASYRVDVLGPLAVGQLEQVFVNESAQAVSARYAGNPPGISVRATEVEVAGRTQELQSPVETPKGKDRAAAASRAGRQRPAPAPQAATPQAIDVGAGETATVRTTFRVALPIRDGKLKLVLPAVTEPASESYGPSGTISVTIHHDQPLPFAESATHDVMAVYEGDRTIVEPAAGEMPSREFELEFAIGAEDDSTLLGNVTRTEDDVHEIVAVLTPPMAPPDETVRPKEVLFLLDVSGSMANGKLEQARAALGACLEKLRPSDRFDIVGFNSEVRLFDEAPVGAEEVQRAMGWLRRLSHGGGTVLLPAMETMLRQPVSEEHHRMIVLLTDGALQDRDKVLQLLQSDLGEGRMFAIGIGTDVVRQTIEQMAAMGRGVAVFAEDADALQTVMTAMFESVAEPLAWDLALDLGGAEVESMEPANLPDLYAGRPVTVRARVRGELPGELAIEAVTTSGLRRFTTTLAPDERLSGLGN